MHLRDRSATETCLSLPEIISQVGSYLFEPGDLFAASCVNHPWNTALLPLRAYYPHVALEHLPSFLSFLKSNRRVAHHIKALRILCDDLDDDEDNDPDHNSETSSDVDMDRADGDAVSDATNATVIKRSDTKTQVEFKQAAVDIMNHLADIGKLRFFMYALPGEPHEALPDGVLLALRRMSDTLQGIYIELIGKHWDIFLSTRFSNLTYLRLFLDSDESVSENTGHGAFDPKAALLTFLQSHPRLEILHLYLGSSFAHLDLTSVRLPSLCSFLLVSRAEGISIGPFLLAHPELRSLDVYTDTDFPPLPADSLPNVQALQVSALTTSWFINILKSSAQRAQPIRHLQITAARQNNFRDVLEKVAPLGKSLRGLELIFWSRDVPLISVLEDVHRSFPKLVEISLFIPSWGSADWEVEDNPVDLASMLQCFSQNIDLLAFSVSDPKTELIVKEDIEALPRTCIPPNLRYIVWRSQTFRLDRGSLSETPASTEGTVLRVERTYHPRNFRGSRYLRDWYEEMCLDHLAGDYEAQLLTSPTD